jgi:glycogen debranching enzyme
MSIRTTSCWIRTLTRSIADLSALSERRAAPGRALPGGRDPWFATLFGRDSIIAALETVAFIPILRSGDPRRAGPLQATTDDPWHDAEPGKILTRLRTGEMARAGETPHDAYYGSVDSTPLWLILLGEAHAWTGDDAMLDRLWPNALAALAGSTIRATSTATAFVEYRRRSKLGLLNQGWKDSGDAIRHTDGKPAVGPIALGGGPGLCLRAKRCDGQAGPHRGEMELAARLDTAADVLRDQFDDAFWMPKARFLRDGPRRREAPGREHRLERRAGAVERDRPDRARRPGRRADPRARHVLRLGCPDRSQSGQPGYNPVGYHTGSIWPHDNALIAAGLKASGATDGANLLAGRLIEAAQWFPDLRLPELFCGFTRDEVGRAGRLSRRLFAAGMGRRRAVLSLAHDARAPCGRHGNRLELIRPNLPEWLGKITIKGLPVG